MRLTQKEISRLVLPRGKSEVIYFDDDLAGFGLRLRASGAARWVYQYKVGPKHRRMMLGNLKSVKPDAAREAAKKLYAEVIKGDVPAGKRAEKRAHAAKTLGAAIDQYLADRQAELKPRSLVGRRVCSPTRDRGAVLGRVRQGQEGAQQEPTRPAVEAFPRSS